MKDYHVVRYDSGNYKIWNDFIATAKNATFLFHRDFMEYHGDRFEDYSLLIFKKEKLIAVLPANSKEDTLVTHQGLTYGGLVIKASLKFQVFIELMEVLLKYLDSNSIKYVYWKELPEMYSLVPSSEWNYLMTILNAKLEFTNLLSVIDLNKQFKISSNRKEGVRRAHKHNLNIEEVEDLNGFWKTVLIPNLKSRYDVQPVHNLAEIEYLKSKFPSYIRQFNVSKTNELVAGATIFETKRVAHVQYISANENRSELGSLDFLFDHLITKEFNKKDFFDFGTSNENDGKNLNKGLLYWKEGFGARTATQNFYRIETKNHERLNKVFI